MQVFRNTLRSLMIILIAGVPVFAEFDFGAKYAGDYLTGQSDARLLALGGAGVAIANGPNAVLANPARLFGSRDQSLSMMHADRFSGEVMVDHISYVRRVSDTQMMGFGLIRQGIDDIPVTQYLGNGDSDTNPTRLIKFTSASEYAFQAAYALDKPYGRIGASAKLLYKRLYESDAAGLGFDIGYSLDWKGVILGAQVRDVLSTLLVWDTGRQETIAPSGRLGIAYPIYIDRLYARFTPVAEVELRGESADDPDFAAFHGGLEYTIQNIVSLRVGVDDRRLTYGGGLLIGPINLNYAFIGHQDLGNTHRVSLGYAWGLTQ